jgi:hypothetical protein
MACNDQVKCPLCEGPGRMGREELLAILTDPNLDQKIAQQVLELTRAAAEDLTGVSSGQTPQTNFERELHTWNPAQAMWRRSPKE